MISDVGLSRCHQWLEEGLSVGIKLGSIKANPNEKSEH